MHIILQLENVKRRAHLEDVSPDVKIILKWILGKRCGFVASNSGQGSVADSFEHDNELSGSKTGG